MKSFIRLLLPVLLAVPLTGPAAAQLVPVGDTFDLGGSNELNASTAAAARPDGTYLVLATDGDATTNALYLRIVGPGGAWIDQMVIDSQGAMSPAIAIRPDGGFLVVYQKAGEILGLLFDRDGQEETRLLIGPRRQPSLWNNEPSVAVAADGSWMVAWQETDPSVSTFGTILGRWLAPDGTPETPPTVLDQPSTQQHLPRVSTVPDGGFFVSWTEISGDIVIPVHPYELRGRRFDGQGNALHGTTHLAYSSQGRLFPRPGHDGLILLTNGNAGAVLQPLDLDGQLAGPSVMTGLPVLEDPDSSTLDETGRLLVMSMEAGELAFARLFDASSVQPLSTVFTVPSLHGAKLLKHLASAWPGQFLAFWQGITTIANPIPLGFEGQILTLGCGASPEELCLGNGRFRVRVSWRDHQGHTGAGRPVPLGDDTGTFSFFSTSNVELLVKILDGRSLNGHFWVFYGSLSDVEYEIRVEDTVTGQVRTYQNPSGHIASQADVRAFPDAGTASAASRLTAPPSLLPRKVTAPLTPPLPLTCFYGDFALCLLGRQYEVTVDFVDPRTGESRQARALPFSWESGAFWFFDKGNVELYVKVLDGSAVNGRAWVFHGALTDVEYTITVRLTAHPLETWTYHNPRGRMFSGADTSALPPPGSSSFSPEMRRQP